MAEPQKLGYNSRMKNTSTKKYPTIACCGIDCGLCPRYHTVGTSRCPGCLGENFREKHPSCSIITCCVKTHGLETCGECEEFICRKIEHWDRGDSFVTHRNCLSNLKSIRQNGLDAFIKQQKKRIRLLEELIKEYDDGRSKRFYCLSAALLPIDAIRKAMGKAKNHAKTSVDRKQIAAMLKDAFNTIAAETDIELTYRKVSEDT